MIAVRPTRSIRLPDYHYMAPGAYLVTLWAHQMLPLFGQVRDHSLCLARVGHIIQEEWLGLPDRYPRVHLDLYVIMPNHLHGLFWLVPDVGPGDQRPRQPMPGETPAGDALRLDAWAADPVSLVMGTFKRCVTERAVPVLGPEQRVFQRDFWEYVVRNEDELRSFRTHIEQNPRRWGSDRYYVAGAEVG